MVAAERDSGAGLYGLGADMDLVEGLAERIGAYGDNGEADEDDRGEAEDGEAEIGMDDLRGV